MRPWRGGPPGEKLLARRRGDEWRRAAPVGKLLDLGPLSLPLGDGELVREYNRPAP